MSDSNRNLYILSKAVPRSFTPYLNFEEIFPKFDNTPGFSAGLVTFAFAPHYATTGTFYTVHLEDPGKSGTTAPTNATTPGLDLSGGYTPTASVNPPAGTVVRQAVLVEWRDTDIADGTFQGTAREILRVGFAGNIHPLGDLIFNPQRATGPSGLRQPVHRRRRRSIGGERPARPTPFPSDSIRCRARSCASHRIST